MMLIQWLRKLLQTDIKYRNAAVDIKVNLENFQLRENLTEYNLTIPGIFISGIESNFLYLYFSSLQPMLYIRGQLTSDPGKR
jgi:hypothetical protein